MLAGTLQWVHLGLEPLTAVCSFGRTQLFPLFCSEDLSLGLLRGIRCIHTCGSGARCENGNAGLGG